MTRSLYMGLDLCGNPINGLRDPVAAQDAATKSYADTAISWGFYHRKPLDPTYGDACASAAIDGRWTKAGTTPMAVVADSVKYALSYAVATDRMTQAFTDTGQDFELIAHIQSQVDIKDMLGLVALNASGNGVGLANWADGGYIALWGVTAYTWTSEAFSVASPPLAGYWQSLKRAGGVWSAKWALTDGPWHALVGTAPVYASAITKIGVANIYNETHSGTAELHLFDYAEPFVF